mgnify:CR=1 FL=1
MMAATGSPAGTFAATAAAGAAVVVASIGWFASVMITPAGLAIFTQFGYT